MVVISEMRALALQVLMNTAKSLSWRQRPFLRVAATPDSVVQESDSKIQNIFKREGERRVHMVEMRIIRIIQSIITIAVGFYLGTYFGHLMNLSPIEMGFLAGGICLLANIITTPLLGLQR